MSGAPALNLADRTGPVSLVTKEAFANAFANVGSPKFDVGGGGAPTAPMGPSIQSITDARATAGKPDEYLIWVKEHEASRFQEPGWVKLEPPINGGVLFVHRGREGQAVRKQGIQ